MRRSCRFCSIFNLEGVVIVSGLLGKINIQMLSPFGDKENFEAGYIDSAKFLNSETSLSTAQAVDAYGRALAYLSKDTYDNTTVSCEIPIDSSTATSSSLSTDTEITGTVSFNISSLSGGGEPMNDFWKSTGMKIDATPLFRSDTQIAFLSEMDQFGSGYCSLSSNLQYNSAKLSGYKFDINEIVAEG